MTVYGVDAIDAAFAATNGDRPRLIVRRSDLVTPLARDQANELGVEIVVESSNVPPQVKAAPANLFRRPGFPAIAPQHPTDVLTAAQPTLHRAPSPALYRRGAPLAPMLLPSSTRPRDLAALSSTQTSRVARVVVLGAGHVGMIAAMRLAEADLIDEIVLVDVADGLAAGMALDISHSAGILGFTTRLRGEMTVEAAGAASYTIITAGKARKPGMSRSDLVEVNAAILGDLARSVATVSPNGVILVVTNPLDEMTEHVWQQSGLPSSRVIGMAGVLDTARLTSLIGQTGLARSDQIHGFALGSHGDEMVVPRSLLTVNGKPLAEQIDSPTLDAIVLRTRDSGAEVVGLLKTGSAFITPGLSAAQMVIGMIRNEDRIVAATVRASGEYGIDATYIGLPVRLAKDGLHSIVELDLTRDELTELASAAARITERISSIPAEAIRS